MEITELYDVLLAIEQQANTQGWGRRQRARREGLRLPIAPPGGLLGEVGRPVEAVDASGREMYVFTVAQCLRMLAQLRAILLEESGLRRPPGR